jgi:signal transduction histidine kinase
VEITGKLLKDQKGKIIGLQGSTKDISERIAIENELVESRHELSLRNRIANVFLTSDSDQLFQDILEILLEEFISPMGYFGYVNNKNELVCPSLSQKIKEESNLKERSTILPQSTWEGIWGQSLMEKRTLASNEKLTLPPGNKSVQNVICLPITIKEELLGQFCLANKPGGYTETDQKILENIADYIAPILHSYLEEVRLKKAQEEAFTLLKTAKEKAEESDQLKSAFLLNLSHELRTPLNAILGFTNILAEQVKDSEDGDLFTSQIAAAGNDLMKMIDDTIIMAKLESGQIEPDPVNQKLENTLLQIEDEFHKVYLKGNKDIEFQMVDKTNGILLNTDHQKLKSALNNLLDNAVKYSGKGSVELGAYKINERNLIVYVKDNGIGISVENHKSIFEKFRKIEVKEKFYRGTGLGLAISKGLVDVIGGTIEIDSAPGEGTTVSISLPIDLEKKIA